MITQSLIIRGNPEKCEIECEITKESGKTLVNFFISVPRLNVSVTEVAAFPKTPSWLELKELREYLTKEALESLNIELLKRNIK